MGLCPLMTAAMSGVRPSSSLLTSLATSPLLSCKSQRSGRRREKGRVLCRAYKGAGGWTRPCMPGCSGTRLACCTCGRAAVVACAAGPHLSYVCCSLLEGVHSLYGSRAHWRQLQHTTAQTSCKDDQWCEVGRKVHRTVSCREPYAAASRGSSKPAGHPPWAAAHARI